MKQEITTSGGFALIPTTGMVHCTLAIYSDVRSFALIPTTGMVH